MLFYRTSCAAAAGGNDRTEGMNNMQNQTDSHDFSTGSIGRHIINQAIPLMVAQLVQLLYNVVDRIYIGHLPGEDGMALTGIGLVFPIVSLISAFTNLFGTGGAPLFAISRGAGEEEEAERLMGTTAVLLLTTSVVLTAGCFVLKRPLLYLLGASDATFPYADRYLAVYLLGTPFLMLGTGMNGFITAQGFPKTAMLTTMLGAGLNLVLDPVFIFVLHMDLRGAAIATVLSQIVSAIWVIRFLTGTKAIVPLRRDRMRVQRKRVFRIAALGMSGFIMAATNSVTQLVCNVMLGIYGGDVYIGIMSILNSVREIFSLPIIGLTSGAQPVLGYNYGARKLARVKRGIVFLSLTGGAYTVLSWLLLMLCPAVFLSVFTSNADMIGLGVQAVQIYFSGFVFMLFQFSGQSVFVALERSKHAIFFSLFRKVIIVFPLTVFLPMVMANPVNGVFWAEPISNVVGGLACYLTMYFTLYRRLGRDAAA